MPTNLAIPALLKSFTLFINVKAIAKLNQEHSGKFEIKVIAVVVNVLQITQNLVISRWCFAEDGKEMYQELESMCTAIVLARERRITLSTG